MTTRPFAPGRSEQLVQPGPLTLLVSEMPPTLSPDEALFCLFSEPAAKNSDQGTDGSNVEGVRPVA
jgi:hypothetical protein